jgi:hypothetical protein
VKGGGDQRSAALWSNQAGLGRFQKRKPRPPCRGFLPLRVPPPSSRESHLLREWFNVARQGRQNGAKVNSSCLALNTQGGVTATACDGFLLSHHRFPPNGTRSPGVPPVRRGFTYEGLGTSVSSGEGGLEVRLGPFGGTSVAAALADVRVFGSVPGSSHLQSGENNPQRNFIRLMALTSQTRCARHGLS